MNDFKLIVFGANASMRMGGEAQKPFRFYDAYKAHGWSPTLVVHERNIKEVTERYPTSEGHNIYVLKDTKVQSWSYTLSALLRPISPALYPFFSFIIWMIAQRAIQRALPEISQGHRAVVHIVNPISLFVPLLPLPAPHLTVVGPLALGPGSSLTAELGSMKMGFVLKRACGQILNKAIAGKRRANVILCDGAQAVALARRQFGAAPKIHELLHNGVDDSWFDIKRAPDGHQKRVLYVGRLDRWKGVHYLIRAVRKMPEDVILEIIGDGEERKALLREAGPELGRRIIFTSWLSHAEIGSKYAQASVFISPSYAETGGTSLQEAMAAGVPVIATAWGGHIERLPETCGLLIEPPRRHKDAAFPRQIAQAIQQVLDDPRAAQERAEKARKFVYDTARWRIIGAAAVSIIEQEVAKASEAQGDSHGRN